MLNVPVASARILPVELRETLTALCAPAARVNKKRFLRAGVRPGRAQLCHSLAGAKQITEFSLMASDF